MLMHDMCICSWMYVFGICFPDNGSFYFNGDRGEKNGNPSQLVSDEWQTWHEQLAASVNS